MSKSVLTKFEGRQIKLTNLDKIIYPSIGVSKAEIIQYYTNVAPHLFRYIKDRPLTLIRFPDGIESKSFYTKQKPTWTPKWINDYSIQHSAEEIQYLVPDELGIIPWLANLSALEIHPMQGKVQSINQPDFMVFDLDPPEQADFSLVKEVAFLLKEHLESLGHIPFIKTSGSKGLHILVKLDGQQSYEQVYQKLKNISANFVAKYPKKSTGQLNKAKRDGRVLIDIFRNHIHNTTVAAFSLRGKKGAPLSWPISWETLEVINTSKLVHIRNYDDYLSTGIKVMDEFYDSLITKTTSLHAQSALVINKIDLDYKPDHMLATQESKPPQGAKYEYEIKWDGIRIFIVISDEIQILSRSGRDITEQFPEIIEHIDTTKLAESILDGELVCLNSVGVPVFSDIISRMHNKKSTTLHKSKPSTFFAFDIITHHGDSVQKLALHKRRSILKENLIINSFIKFSDSFSDGDELFEAGKSMGIEGIMAKNRFSKYQEGQRSQDWIKIKYRHQAVCKIIGYTKGQGDRSGLPGSFHLVELHQDGKIYRGRVGTGFDNAKLKNLKSLLEEFVVKTKPIEQKVDEENKTIWVKDKLMCLIEYASLTNNNTFREPVFVKLIEE